MIIALVLLQLPLISWDNFFPENKWKTMALTVTLVASSRSLVHNASGQAVKVCQAVRAKSGLRSKHYFHWKCTPGASGILPEQINMKKMSEVGWKLNCLPGLQDSVRLEVRDFETRVLAARSASIPIQMVARKTWLLDASKDSSILAERMRIGTYQVTSAMWISFEASGRWFFQLFQLTSSDMSWCQLLPSNWKVVGHHNGTHGWGNPPWSR